MKSEYGNGMNFTKYLFAIFAVVCFNSQAADTYDPSKSTLTIPLVKVGDAYYSNVIITLGSVVSVGSASSSYLPYDTYTASSNQLEIPQVTSGSTTYYNVVIKAGPILSVGASCATAAACTPSTTTTASIYATPATYASSIQTSYVAPTLTSASSLTGRSRYLISDSATQGTSANYLQIGDTYAPPLAMR